MTLPAPRLDDRSFQDLVNDAKRYIQERCPAWTDHNVSDPGITLIEAFAWMTDLLLYRLNRVPERVQVKFLDMIGLQLFPPSAATVDVDFRVAAAQESPMTVPRGTIVATRRIAGDLPIEFTTTQDLVIEVGHVAYVGIGGRNGPTQDVTNRLGLTPEGVPMFASPPAVDDSLYIGLDRALPRHSIQLRFSCVRGAGAGIRTSAPPIVWEALVADEWVACDWTDETRGFNVDGTVEVHLPAGHQTLPVDRPDVARAGMIRCRVRSISETEKDKLGVTPYKASPAVLAVTAHVTGATVDAVNARFVEREVLGESRGVSGQEFQLQHAPVVISDEAFVVSVARPLLGEEIGTDGHDLPRATSESWETTTWELVSSFSESGEDDRHFVLDRATGTIRFGPMVREEDGRPRCYGAFPPKGAVISVPRYRVGGGRRGNVTAGAIQVLRTSIPSITVTNRRPATGGADGETVEEGTVRGPIELRSRNRAVTVEDFEALTRVADPRIRRARCIVDEQEPHAVRVLMVPAVGHAGSQLSLNDLEPSPETCDRVERYLDERRLVGTRVRAEPPEYTGLRVRATIMVEARYEPAAVREAALAALYVHFDPLVGGRDGCGWEFGRTIRVGEVYGVLQRVAGVDVVTSATIAFCDSEDGTGEEDMGATMELFANQLVLSREHEIEVVT